jgi:hypothetical protein
MIPRRPKLDQRNREDIALYSTDDLRRLYREAENTKLVRLRDGIVSRDELKAEIRWRVWWEAWISRLTLLAAVIGASAAIVAVAEGSGAAWPWKGGSALSAQWLNTIGLVLGIAGVVIIFFWGPPQPDFDDTIGIALQPGTVFADGTKVSDMMEDTKRRKRRHEVMSRVGLGMIGLGFVAQLIAVWR